MKRHPLHGVFAHFYYTTNCAIWSIYTQEYNAPYHGVLLYSGNREWPWKGKNSVYRYHIEDPIRFRQSVKVTIEHGHANKLSNDYSSTAYYYLSEPKGTGVQLLPVEERLPRPNEPRYGG